MVTTTSYRGLCPNCRKGWKNGPGGPCPECGGDIITVSWRYRVPPKRNAKAWSDITRGKFMWDSRSMEKRLAKSSEKYDYRNDTIFIPPKAQYKKLKKIMRPIKHVSVGYSKGLSACLIIDRLDKANVKEIAAAISKFMAEEWVEKECFFLYLKSAEGDNSLRGYFEGAENLKLFSEKLMGELSKIHAEADEITFSNMPHGVFARKITQ